jgi:cell division septum initiation protein DivIVA
MTDPDQKNRGRNPKARGNGSPPLSDSDKVSSLLATTGKEVKQLLEAADDAAAKIREAHKETTTAGDEGSGDSDKASSLIARTSREVQQVLESADEAAEKIREEAREEARQFLRQAQRRAESVTSEHMDRVSAMTERVLDEVSGVERQLEVLRTAFDQAIKTMGADLGIEQTGVWDTQENGATTNIEEQSASLRRRLRRRRRRKFIAPQEPEGISEGARLLALQQMMAGVDSKVIEARLKKEFGIEDPQPILDWLGMQQEKR